MMRYCPCHLSMQRNQFKSIYFENSNIAVICFKKYPVTHHLKILQNIIFYTIVLACFLWQVINKNSEHNLLRKTAKQKSTPHTHTQPPSPLQNGHRVRELQETIVQLPICQLFETQLMLQKLVMTQKEAFWNSLLLFLVPQKNILCNESSGNSE